MPPYISPVVHVFFAAIGLFSGFLAMSLRKGSGLHGAAGTLFSVSMLIATAAGAYGAAFLRPNTANVMGSTLTFYLVATGWAAARRKEVKPGVFEAGALLFALALAGLAANWGLDALASPDGRKDEFPAAFYFIFGSMALLFAISDLRMILRGGISGARRIARHLLRNSLALFFAMMSLYPGNARLFPQSWRATNLLWVPAVLIIGSMFFWLVRVRVTNRSRRMEVHA
jgi:hypothetical protein